MTPDGDEQPKPVRAGGNLVRIQKSVLFDFDAVSQHFDETMINPLFYDRFSYSLLPTERPRGKLVLGITSPGRGDGKTLVASNLAVSLALSTENEVLLMDMNIQRPKIHELFSVHRKPGLMESLDGSTIHVTPTRIRNLAVFPLGDSVSNPIQGIRLAGSGDRNEHHSATEGLKLEHLPEFRNVIFSLEEKFDLIIVDLPSLGESVIPKLFMKHLDGIVVVINTGKTKKEDVDELLNHVDRNQILGFVLNRASTGRVV